MQCSAFPQVMISIAQERSLTAVLQAVVRGVAGCSDVALARIWLIKPGDICAECNLASECPDRTRCLHLVASAGRSKDPQADTTRLDGRFRRFPLGVRKIGVIAQSGTPLFIPGLTEDEPWVADRDWIRREGVKTFAAQPLVFRDELLGVLAIFDRGLLGRDEFEWLRVFADHAAVSMVNARSFEEIDALRARLEDENVYLREEVTDALGAGDIIGNSPGLRKVTQQVQLVSPTDAAVLITGESGTGKELIARAIHDHSARKARAIIKVNCSAVPDGLFESEFFGHVRGAFTGALKDRLGRFELADGGTLFLDEIGDVPLATQAKLLRVLQEHELERVGDTRTRKVDVRIIAATHRNLRSEVAAGRFREDLFYRLSVFPIEIPPLRERREDIPPLVTHFVKQSARRLNLPVPRLSRATLSQLVHHTWPGNVRELQNAIERAVILAEGRPLQFDLPKDDAGRPSRALPPVAPVDAPLTRAELKRRERENIAAALAQSGGKIFGPRGAAELLGMKPTTLASRVRALGLKTGANG
jgi:transcriptional regulator with GAF, ATPase, and Fis domain